jgi:hypothetical protein
VDQLEKYLSLDQKGTIIAEYIWYVCAWFMFDSFALVTQLTVMARIDSEGGTRSKSRVRLPQRLVLPTV